MHITAAINQVYAYWCAHAEPETMHRVWLEHHARLLPELRRNKPVPTARQGTDYMYTVVSGLVARVVYHADGKRRILRVVQRGETFSTAINLYTDKRPEGTYIALRSTRLLQLPAGELKKLKEADRAGDDLVDAWREREKKGKVAHNALLLVPDDQQRVLLFRERDPELCSQLSYQDIADYLNVSRDTVRRAFNPRRNG